MARRGNQPKRGIDQNHKTCSKSKKKDVDVEGIADELLGSEHLNSNLKDGNMSSLIGDGRKKNKRSKNASQKHEPMADDVDVGPSFLDNSISEESVEKLTSDSGLLHVRNHSSQSRDGAGSYTHGRAAEVQFFHIVVLESLRHSALSIFATSRGWLERQKPVFTAVARNIYIIRDHVQLKLVQAYPVVLKWLFRLGNILLLVSMVWLDCAFRGMDSFLRMGTTSCLSILWFSMLSVLAMIGMVKFVLVLAFAVLIGYFLGIIISLLLIGITGGMLLWCYGSFWTTSVVIVLAGLTFILRRERLALLITTVYSLYCAWSYVGWLGVLLGFNLSFISSDALVYFLKHNIDEQRSKPLFEQTDRTQGEQSFFNGEAHSHPLDIGSGLSDRSAGVPSTSGTDSEITSEDEIIHLLNCTDHYSALGLSRYQQVDVSVLKREYRKKAMLVHPDKNMGNEKAAEAFKKLQNAYEVLLDSLKRKAYDDELRKEELLNYFCRFQNPSQKNRRHGNGGDPHVEARRIACKKCGRFHIWIQTKKSKLKARWCQDCEDFHQAKDRDGWVEQSSQPLLFGILRKVDVPVAYVCADGIVYDATEWYICQGMRCPPNSHKPSFHVNTSVTKNNFGKSSSSSHRGGPGASNMEENMTEDEFFEWLQNAVQSGMFENVDGASPNESSRTSMKNNGKSGGANTSGGSCRRKKGKKR